MSMTTNFTAHAVDDMERLRSEAKAGRPCLATSNLQLFEMLLERLKSSVKFRLPDNGILLGISDPFPLLQEFHRLPYPCITIEYHASGDNSYRPFDHRTVQFDQPERVLLAWEEGEHLHLWLMMKIMGVYRPYEAGVVFNFGGPEITNRVVPLADTIANWYRQKMSDDEVRTHVLNNYADEVRSLADFCGALACRNVATVDDLPSANLNKARQRRGKQPFYTYKTLVLTVDAATTAVAQGGTHASPRAHLRRGHIRRLLKGPVWVNAAVVGNKKLGFVHKDYEMQAGS